MTDDTLRPARRVLHVCYCCSDLDRASSFFVDGFAMRKTMGTPANKSSGAILGLDGDVVSPTHFVYDVRGPRTSPAIEVQAWVEPPLTGTPLDDPTRVGIQALGFAVPDVDATTKALTASGCAVRGSGPSPFDGSAWVTLRDPTGVTIDVVEDAAIPAGESRLRHLRVTCSDLEASRAWYEGVGFAALGDAANITDMSFLDHDRTGVSAHALHLRLPDEPFEVILVEWRSPPGHGQRGERAEPRRALPRRPRCRRHARLVRGDVGRGLGLRAAADEHRDDWHTRPADVDLLPPRPRRGSLRARRAAALRLPLKHARPVQPSARCRRARAASRNGWRARVSASAPAAMLASAPTRTIVPTGGPLSPGRGRTAPA